VNEFDLGIIVFVGLSGLFALARGFVKEVLSVIAWFGASLAALYAFPYLRPFAQRFTPSPEVADAASSLTAFIVALVILSFITAAVSRRVKDSPLSAIDRTLGLCFGVARGLLLAVLIFIALNTVLPALGAVPPWFAQARTRPLLEEGAAALKELAPRSLHEPSHAGGSTVEQELNDALKAFSTPKSQAQPGDPSPAYSPQDQRNMDKLIQQNQGH
jgi:membrane protein required for colicin V production